MMMDLIYIELQYCWITQFTHTNDLNCNRKGGFTTPELKLCTCLIGLAAPTYSSFLGKIKKNVKRPVEFELWTVQSRAKRFTT